MDIYDLVYLHHYALVSEMINISFYKKDREQFFNYLFMYIKQFYSNTGLKEINNPIELEKAFNKYLMLVNDELLAELTRGNLEYINMNLNLFEEALELFGIVTDLMIRFYGYSIVGIQDQKIIVTSSNNCEKRFIDYLLEGYSLFKLQGVYLINDGKSIDSMHYEFLPCLHTKDM